MHHQPTKKKKGEIGGGNNRCPGIHVRKMCGALPQQRSKGANVWFYYIGSDGGGAREEGGGDGAGHTP